MHSAQSRFIAGIKAISPILLGVIPFAMIAGISSVEVGLNFTETMQISMILFAGAAQLAALQLISEQANAWVIILTAWIINLRFLLYGASLAPHLRSASSKWKPLLAFLITDQAYAVSILEFEGNQKRANKHWYYFGAAALMWLTWLVGIVAGALLGAQVPAVWSLDFAIPLTFIALLVPAIKDRPAVAAAIVAGLLSVFLIELPSNLSLPIAVIIGIGVGLLVEGVAE
ncbi:MAG: AzlC family ABC transporter permease [Chloroflexi bacterium]|nr:AzlC family ABC transporter permease [Chloroflexota bacterium]